MSEAPSRAASRRGRTLKLYLVDGSPSGVITAELGISSVRAAVASRTALPDLIRREEAGRTGIYLLVGPDPDLPGRQLVYVGEGDQVKTRLAAHDGDESKDSSRGRCWSVSKDENLTKAHGRYLESRIIAAIRMRAAPSSSTAPSRPSRGCRSRKSPIWSGCSTKSRSCCRCSGSMCFVRRDRKLARQAEETKFAGIAAPATSGIDALFTFTEAGTDARAREASDEFVVLAGFSRQVPEVPSCSEGLKRRRAQLIADGVLVPDGDGKFLRFTADTAFDSPSGAAGTVYGGNVSGNRYWKHATTGQSYGDWRKRQIGEGGEA